MATRSSSSMPNGNMTVPGTLSVSATSTVAALNVGGELSVSAQATVQALRVDGIISASAAAVFGRITATSLNVTGVLSISGAATFLTTDTRIAHTATSGAANCYIDATTTAVQRSTSSLRYKSVEGELGLEDARNIILNSKPISFRPKWGGERYVGFAAEHMYELDKRVTTVDKDGRPDWVQYPALTAPLAKVAQDHEARLKKLEQLLGEQDGDDATRRHPDR